MFWDRRGARGSRREPRGKRSALFPLVLAMHAGGSVFTADYYAVDGVSGKVASFIDWLDPTHLLAQSTSAQQVAIPAGHADYAGALCATFAGAQWYTSSRAASTWAYATDVPGFEHAATWSPTSVTAAATIMGTNAANGAPGITWNFAAGGATPGRTLRKAAGGLISNITTGSMTTQPYLLQHRHVVTDNPDVTTKMTGSSELSADYTGPPAAAATPSGPYTIGARPGGANPVSARWRSLALVPGVLSASNRAIRDAWVLADTGIAA